MKKEKKVRAYQRRTKSGKTVTVRAHTASYEAAEKAKEAAKKKGAGDEIAERKKKNWELPMDEFLKKLKEERAQKREDEEPKNVEDEKPKKSEKKTEKKASSKKRTVGTGTNGPEPKKKTTTKKTSTKADDSEPAFTRDEFKEWYRGTGSAADKKVAKALRKQLGRSGYRKFEDEAINNYTSRGHLSMFKRVSGGSGVNDSKNGAEISKAKKDTARGSKEKATEAKSSKAKGSKSVKAPKKESLKQRDARWNRGEFTDDEKATAIMVYDMSGSKNNLHPKLSAWAKKEIKRMDDERAAKVDTKILKGLNRDVVSKLATLQGKKKLSKEDEAFIDKHVAPSGLIRGTKVSAFDAISAHRKDSKQASSKRKSWERESGKLMTERMRLDMEGKGMLRPLNKKSDYKDPVGEGVKRKHPKPIVKRRKYPISEESLNSKGFKTFKMPQIGTLYLGKKGKGAYIKFKGKKTIQKADIDDYGDFITGHNGLTKSQKKQLSSLGYTEHEEY